MKKTKQQDQPYVASRANPLSKNENHLTMLSVAQLEGVHVNAVRTPCNVSTADTSTVVCYEDISIDYSQYYKVGPITFEDLLSDDSCSLSSEENDITNDLHDNEDRNILRAVTYHKFRILQLCFTCWRRLVLMKYQKASQLYRRHLLRQGWKAFRWSMMLGHELAKMGVWHHQRWKHRRVFLKWKVAMVRKRHERVAHAFYLWRHLARIQISSCVFQLALQRKVLRGFWDWWKISLQSARQGRLAIQHLKCVTLRKSFTALLINTNIGKQKRLASDLSEEFHFTVIKRDCFMHWRMTFHQALTARRHYNHMLLLSTLRNWHDVSARSRYHFLQLQSQAEQQWCSSSLKRCLSHWYLQLLERRALKFRSTLLLSRYFHIWNSQQQLVWYRASSADNYYRQIIMKSMFNQWKIKCLEVRTTRADLESIMRKEILQNYFDSWRDISSVSNSLRVVQQDCMKKLNIKILASHFTFWRDSTITVQQNNAANQLFYLHLKRRIFGTWRLFIYQQTLRHASKLFVMEKRRNVLQKYFDRWVCETACRVGENVISNRLYSALCLHRLRKAFLAWQVATRTTLATNHIHTMVMKKFFNKWRQYWNERCIVNSTLIYSANMSMLGKWFDKWKCLSHSHTQTKLADKQYATTLLRRSLKFLKNDHKRQQAANEFFCSVQRSSLVACFVRWRAILCTRQQLEGMKRSIKFQQNHLVKRCFVAWLELTRVRQESVNTVVSDLNLVLASLRQRTAWNTWKRQLLCHHMLRDHLKTKSFISMKCCFHHWRCTAEQSLENLSATFIAKFQVSALCSARNATSESSPLRNILTPASNSELVSQYRMSVLSPQVSTFNNSFIDLPVNSSTPQFPSRDTNIVNDFQHGDDVKRQLFNDHSITQDSKLSPPCRCLNAEMISQLTDLQQDFNSISISVSGLLQGNDTSNLTDDGVITHFDNIISPPVEFSERDNDSLPGSPVSTISTETISTMESVAYNSTDIQWQFASNDSSSYVLFSKMVSIVKLMQHYPVSVAFVAWRRFVQKRKSLAVIGASVHSKMNHNILMYAFSSWRLRTCKSLEYKQLEMSLLVTHQKRILSVTVQKWITAYHKRLKENCTLDNLLTSRNQSLVIHSFCKWRRAFEMNSRLRNHLDIAILLRCLHSWRSYCVSKRTLKAKIEHVQTKLKRAVLSACFIQWSNEAKKTGVLRMCLHHWVRYITVKGQLKSVAVAFEEKRCVIVKRNLFLKWRCMARASIAIQNVHRQRLLKKLFISWRCLCMKKKEELLHQKHEESRQAVASVFAHWKKITEQTKMAKKLDYIRLLHYGWKKWRLSAVREKVSMQVATADNRLLIKKVFNAWRTIVVLTEVSDHDDTLLTVEEDKNIVHLYFKYWKTHCKHARHKI